MLNGRRKDRLERVLKVCFKEIHEIYTRGDFREESFYPTLKELIEECSRLLPPEGRAGVLVQPKKTEVGIPDFLRRDGEIIGYIEAKSPDADPRVLAESEQLKRYRESIPNLILTNFLEFRLYRSLGTVTRHGVKLETEVMVDFSRMSIVTSLRDEPKIWSDCKVTNSEGTDNIEFFF